MSVLGLLEYDPDDEGESEGGDVDEDLSNQPAKEDDEDED